MPIVTLLTDFGTADYFAGAMRGAVLSVNPRALVVDITHEVAAHEIDEGAFTLAAAFEAFPAGTVHVAVVDPGVGSERRPIAVEACGHFFVGPDNGIFEHIYARAGEYRVFHLTNREYFRQGVSTTFHGRDVFAPVAGALSLGISPEALGPIVTDEVRLALVPPRRLEDGTLEASVIHIDRFGNCITNITPGLLSEEAIKRGARVVVNGREISTLRRFYAGAADGEPFLIYGSAGLLEISLNRSSAARLLNAQRGTMVLVNSER